MLAQPSYDSATRLIRTLKPAHRFGAGELVLSMEQLHFFPVGLEAAGVFLFEVPLKMGSKVGTE